MLETILNRIPFSLFFFFLLFNINSAFSQDEKFIIPDSLKNKTFIELIEDSKKHRDTLKKKNYFNTYLQKAKKINNISHEVRAYLDFASYEKNDSLRLNLYDKAILKCDELENVNCACVALLNRGGYYLFLKHDYFKALDDYIRVLKLAEKSNNKVRVNTAKQSIGYIKTLIGEHEEALKLFKEYLVFQKKLNPRYCSGYVPALLLTAESYTYNKKLDSASILNKEGIKIALSNIEEPYGKNIKGFYSLFLFQEGINLFHKKEYIKAKDSLQKGFNIYDKELNPDQREGVLYFYYSAKIELINNNQEKAKSYFSQMDSMYKRTPVVYSETRDGYEFLINYYKNKNKRDIQLEQINNLLRFDSINRYHKDVISNRIRKEYDTPRLLYEKNYIIKELENENHNLHQWFVLFLIFTPIVLFVLLYQSKKKKKYKQKFLLLIKQQELQQEEHLETSSKSKINLEISEKIIENILEQLKDFANEKQYLKKNITIASLSKELKTNSKYLSKVINHYKKKTFIRYINDLRIDYIIEELKENKKIRNYTIQSIAEEIGFNTAESFASAFKKRTGLNPSYFIKNLNKQNEV